MTQCWTEGELRASLDGELPARDMERVAVHVAECRVCGAVYTELRARASRVGVLLECLPETAPVPPVPRVAMRPRQERRWVAYGAGVAASVALVLVLAPRHDIVPQTKSSPTVSKAVPPPAALPAPQVRPAIIRRRAPAKPKSRVEDYIALDNDPIEAGVVVRVGLDAGLGGGPVPADVIFGMDGRARAVRLVTDISGER